MPVTIGIDTSNYTTSIACYDVDSKKVEQIKKPLPVRPGQIGLRQSDAVFSHVKQLGGLARELLNGQKAIAVGVSCYPRDAEGSYMPCFLVGRMAAEVVSAALGIPSYCFSHQAGHIMAALYGAGCPQLAGEELIALHISGGTTECLHVMPGQDRPFQVGIISHSLDLFAGQLVDRVGSMLSLPFPAGPALEALASGYHSPGAKPSFRQGGPCLSGLENQCRQLYGKGAAPGEVAAYCIHSIGNIVEQMTQDALALYPGLPVLYSGGVMSNSIIRNRVVKRFGPEAYFAPPIFSADNAAGTAVLASLCHAKGQKGE